LGFNRPEAAVLNDASVAHNWALDVTDATSFTVSLTALQSNFDLVIKAPDGTVVAESHNPGTTDEVLEVLNAPPGTYMIQVTTPDGEVSVLPYFLRAQLPPPPDIRADVNPYDVLPRDPAMNPYGTP